MVSFHEVLHALAAKFHIVIQFLQREFSQGKPDRAKVLFE